MRLNMSARTRTHVNGVRSFIDHDAFSALDRGCVREFSSAKVSLFCQSFEDLSRPS
jgi:hypothetical protein